MILSTISGRFISPKSEWLYKSLRYLCADKSGNDLQFAFWSHTTVVAEKLEKILRSIFYKLMLIFHFFEFKTVFNTAFNTRRKRSDLSKADDAIACGKDLRLLTTTLNDLKTKTNCRCDQGSLFEVGSMTFAAWHDIESEDVRERMLLVPISLRHFKIVHCFLFGPFHFSHANVDKDWASSENLTFNATIRTSRWEGKGKALESASKSSHVSFLNTKQNIYHKIQSFFSSIVKREQILVFVTSSLDFFLSIHGRYSFISCVCDFKVFDKNMWKLLQIELTDN